MPDLDVLTDLLTQLQAEAQPRPDLITPGSTGTLENARPVTFMGRVVKPGESVQQVVKRVPTAELESGGQAMGAIPQALLAAGAKAAMIPGGRFFHGTPKVFNEFDPKLSKSEGLVGPGVAYMTNSAEHAGGTGVPGTHGGYAAGATHGIGQAPTVEQAVAAGLQPNIRPYAVKPHETLDIAQPLAQADMEKILLGVREHFSNAPATTGFSKSKVNPAQRIQNVQAAVKGSTGHFGQDAFAILQQIVGPETANSILRKGGFQSISYPGGALMGGTPHKAINVLDPTIMKNLFDSLVERKTK